MDLAAWLRATWQRRIDFPGGAGAQCVDLANDYLNRVWLLDPVRADAQQWDRANLPNCTYTRNGPDNAPPPGAIVVWHGPIGSLYLSDAGHVAITLTGGAREFWTWDQNWAGRKYATLNLHTYIGVHGWWSPA